MLIEIRMKSIQYELGNTYLTPREAEYMGGIVEGLTLSKIAERLGISLGTVRTMRDKVNAKTDVHSRSIMVGIALKAGFSSDGNHRLVERKEAVSC